MARVLETWFDDRAPLLRWGVLASYGIVTDSQREPDNNPPQIGTRIVRANDIVFSWAIVLQLFAILVTVLGGIYAGTAGLRLQLEDQKSDTRDILTRMTFQSRLDEEKDKSRDLKFDTMSRNIERLEAAQKLLQLQWQGFQASPQGRPPK